MSNQSFIALPADLDDTVVLRRVLSLIVEQIDLLNGNRGTSTGDAAVSIKQLSALITQLDTRVTSVENAGYITEAPFTGQQYTRGNKEWTVV